MVMNSNSHIYLVYIMTNKHHSVLYTGFTGKGVFRVEEHIHKSRPGFTNFYNINKLVYVESFTEVTKAIAREKQIKRWSRRKKIRLIESKNPQWEDLTGKIRSWI